MDVSDLVALICQTVLIGTESNRTVPKNDSFIQSVQFTFWIMKIFLEAVNSKIRGDVD